MTEVGDFGTHDWMWKRGAIAALGECVADRVSHQSLAILRYLAAQGEAATVSETVLASQFADGWVEAIALLCKRELIKLTSNGYRFQVELIRQWFKR